MLSKQFSSQKNERRKSITIRYVFSKKAITLANEQLTRFQALKALKIICCFDHQNGKKCVTHFALDFFHSLKSLRKVLPLGIHVPQPSIQSKINISETERVESTY